MNEELLETRLRVEFIDVKVALVTIETEFGRSLYPDRITGLEKDHFKSEDVEGNNVDFNIKQCERSAFSGIHVLYFKTEPNSLTFNCDGYQSWTLNKVKSS